MRNDLHLESGKSIISSIMSCDDCEIIQPFLIGKSGWRNEFVLFIKPEMFAVSDTRCIQETLSLVFDKLSKYDVMVNGLSVVGGATLERLGIMSSHYGYINRLSHYASKIITLDDKKKIADALGFSDNFELKGGHEYLEQHPELNYLDLDKLWFTKRSIKIRSGFYVIELGKVVLVNGFHPAQLYHYTNPVHRILLILGHSNTDWKILRNEMIGITYPEKAMPGSIRGDLYASPTKFGLDSVTVANNGIHMSAGPFEAMFEISNFLGKINNLDLEQQHPLMLKKMLAKQICMKDGLRTLENPILIDYPKPIDLFTATEDNNTEEAILLWEKHVATQN